MRKTTAATPLTRIDSAVRSPLVRSDGVGEGQAQDRQQHDAQAGAEVTAVDRGNEGAPGQKEGPRPWRCVRGSTQGPSQEGLGGEEERRPRAPARERGRGTRPTRW